MYVKKEFVWANVLAIVVNALLWLLAIARVFPAVWTLLLFVLSVAGLILLSAKLNGLTILCPKKRYPFHVAPTERAMIPPGPGRAHDRRRGRR